MIGRAYELRMEPNQQRAADGSQSNNEYNKRRDSQAIQIAVQATNPKGNVNNSTQKTPATREELGMVANVVN